MQHNKIKFLFIIPFFLCISCIEEYTPELNSSEAYLYAIDGRITDIEGFHTILVSKSVEISNPQRNPVSNCEVRIYDDNDNVFIADEFRKGEYKTYIPQDYLTYGTAFRLEIHTPEGDILSSEYDTLRYCPDIDSIYYEIEEFVTGNSLEKTPGIQFYLDYNGNNTSTNKIKIELEETWEYHSKYPLKWTYNGWRLTEYSPVDYSKQVCWRTDKSDNTYILSTDKLSSNTYKKFPLHRILNTSNKLLIGYSLLIKQYSISKQAMEYYEKVNSNIISENSLYDTQPQLFEGNIRNLTNPESRVLGYFSTMGMKTKRIFIKHVEDLNMNVKPACEPMSIYLGFLRGNMNTVIIWFEGGDTYRLTPVCVDCTILGGETVKPEFWPY